jgi:hypothetical protein
MCPSSGENTVPMRHPVFVTIYGWLSGVRGGMKLLMMGTQRPKHVEKSNKHIKKNCTPSWFYLQDYTGIHGKQNLKNRNYFVGGTANKARSAILTYGITWRGLPFYGSSSVSLNVASCVLVNNAKFAEEPRRFATLNMAVTDSFDALIHIHSPQVPTSIKSQVSSQLWSVHAYFRPSDGHHTLQHLIRSDFGSLVFHSWPPYIDGKQITAERRDDVSSRVMFRRYAPLRLRIDSRTQYVTTSWTKCL